MVLCLYVDTEERETKPPSRYTDGTLVQAMKKANFGTPATRDSIIETLLKRGYLRREKGKLISTEKGRKLIEVLENKGSKIISPEVTSEWEKKLEEIYTGNRGKEGYLKFLEDIKAFTRNELSLIGCTGKEN